MWAVRQATYLWTSPFLFLFFLLFPSTIGKERNYEIIYYGGSSTSYVPLPQETKRNYEVIYCGGSSTSYVPFDASIFLPLQEKKEITKLAAVGAVRQAM